MNEPIYSPPVWVCDECGHVNLTPGESPVCAVCGRTADDDPDEPTAVDEPGPDCL